MSRRAGEALRVRFMRGGIGGPHGEHAAPLWTCSATVIAELP